MPYSGVHQDCIYRKLDGPIHQVATFESLLFSLRGDGNSPDATPALKSKWEIVEIMLF